MECEHSVECDVGNVKWSAPRCVFRSLLGLVSPTFEREMFRAAFGVSCSEFESVTI